jgi:hypothetical protein
LATLLEKSDHNILELKNLIKIKSDENNNLLYKLTDLELKHKHLYDDNVNNMEKVFNDFKKEKELLIKNIEDKDKIIIENNG